MSSSESATARVVSGVPSVLLAGASSAFVPQRAEISRATAISTQLAKVIFFMHGFLSNQFRLKKRITRRAHTSGTPGQGNEVLKVVRVPHELAEERHVGMQTGAAHSRPLGSNQEVRKIYDPVTIKSREIREIKYGRKTIEFHNSASRGGVPSRNACGWM